MGAVVAGALVGWSTSTGVKSQYIRLVDVFGWGPLVIAAAIFPDMPKPIRQVLAFTGASTITYNARNYLRLRHFPEEMKAFEAVVQARNYSNSPPGALSSMA